jgi:hypothetical protein
MLPTARSVGFRPEDNRPLRMGSQRSFAAVVGSLQFCRTNPPKPKPSTPVSWYHASRCGRHVSVAIFGIVTFAVPTSKPTARHSRRNHHADHWPAAPSWGQAFFLIGFVAWENKAAHVGPQLGLV